VYTVEVPEPGISVIVGALVVNPAAVWKFVISVATTADWPTIAIVCPVPVYPAL
jgi:hypothetical protein